MREVKIGVRDLGEAVRKNREAHVRELAEAKIGHRKAMEEKLLEHLALVQSGADYAPSLGLIEPQDHTEDYDRVLAMLQYTVDTTVTLTVQEFEQYVMDKWHWALGAKALNSGYAMTARAK